MVTICTTSLTFNNSTFCPHTVFMCFVWISEQTAIISLYNINWLVFINEPQCVYCAVGSESINIIQANFSLYSDTNVRPHDRDLLPLFARALSHYPQSAVGRKDHDRHIALSGRVPSVNTSSQWPPHPYTPAACSWAHQETKDTQCVYNLTLRRVLATIFVLKIQKKKILHNLSDCSWR